MPYLGNVPSSFNIGTDNINNDAITTAKIADGAILNADVNSAAAIAGTKISPDFGSQTIATTGIFSHALGSASAPTITFTGDLNTGLYSPGADQLAISTNGTKRLQIDSGGNVSIDAVTNTGAKPLAIYSAARDAEIRLTTNSGTQNDAYFTLRNSGGNVDIYSTNGAITLNPGNTERLRITAAGLVGIGTSTPAGALDVSDGSVASTQSPKIYFCSENGADRVACEIRQGRFNKDVLVVSSNQSLSANLFNAIENGTSRFVITGAGRVGIGTTSPSVKLEVSGTANQNEIRSVDGTINSQWYQDNNGYAIFGTFSNHPQVFRTNGTERVRIQAGNGGISIGSGQNPNALTQSTGIRLGDNTIASYTFTNVTTTPVTIANGVGIGGLAFVQAYNTSNGAQYTGLIMWRSGVTAVISESNSLGFGLTYSVSGSTLRLQTASGTVTGSVITLAS